MQPERYFAWYDEDGVRCSPRHRSMKAALNFKKNWPPKYGYVMDRLSEEEPVTLKALELQERDMTPEEQEGYAMWMKLNQMGLS